MCDCFHVDVKRAYIQVRLKEWYLWPKTASEAISEYISNFKKKLWHAVVPLANACYVHTECAHAVPI